VSASIAQAQSGIAVPKGVIILQSTHEYAAVLAGAKQAAMRLHCPFESGGNHPYPSAGLTLRKTNCAANGYQYPCYSPRGQGRAENSDYISIEYSDGYLGFTKGVLLGSGRVDYAQLGYPAAALDARTLGLSNGLPQTHFGLVWLYALSCRLDT
jgi:hypothetical protein